MSSHLEEEELRSLSASSGEQHFLLLYLFWFVMVFFQILEETRPVEPSFAAKTQEEWRSNFNEEFLQNAVLPKEGFEKSEWKYSSKNKTSNERGTSSSRMEYNYLSINSNLPTLSNNKKSKKKASKDASIFGEVKHFLMGGGAVLLIVVLSSFFSNPEPSFNNVNPATWPDYSEMSQYQQNKETM